MKHLNIFFDKDKPKKQEDPKMPIISTELHIEQQIIPMETAELSFISQNVDCRNINFKEVVNKFQSKILENECQNSKRPIKTSSKKTFAKKYHENLDENLLRKSLVKELSENFLKRNISENEFPTFSCPCSRKLHSAAIIRTNNNA